MKMTEEELAILEQNVINSTEAIIEKRKIKYISNTEEFCEGLSVGLEIAKIYGDKIYELFKKDNNINNS